jgi:regulator of protease activity HflC (stomatin/prohibitin superfamily)
MPRTDMTVYRSSLPAARVPRFNILSTAGFAGPTALGVLLAGLGAGPAAAVVGALVGAILSLSPKIAQQWERAVVMRLGRYVGLRGPGPFWIIPFVDSVGSWVDQRTITTSFAAEETLTSDTVPVNVDAVLFWTVYDPEKAALEVQDYAQAVSWAAQTGLRDIIGRTSLANLLRGRERIEEELKALIDQRSTPWGVTVHSVEMRDVVIPTSLQDAMSREAQASREKQARIILGEAEVEIANLFHQAARAYQNDPIALQLRQMNILYEGLKQKGGMMVVPSSIVDSMGPHGTLSLAALARQQGEEARDPETVGSPEPLTALPPEPR